LSYTKLEVLFSSNQFCRLVHFFRLHFSALAYVEKKWFGSVLALFYRAFTNGFL